MNTLDELVDLHISPKCVIVNNCSKYHMKSYMTLWKSAFLSKYISGCKELCHSVTLLCLLFQVSLGYSYLFNPSAPPLSASKWTIQTQGKYGHIHM